MDHIEAFLQSHNWELLRQINGWDIRRSGSLVFLTLTARDGERFNLRAECTGYPHTAPGVQFVNSEGSTQDARAWPRGNANFHSVVKPPPHCFLCMPLTREGLHHHNEWRGRSTAWNDERSLMDVFNYVSRLLSSKDYEGRGTQT